MSAGITTDSPLLARLIAFADLQHESTHGGCHPEPFADCTPWCEACKVLADVTDAQLVEARALQREWGYDR